MWELASRPLAGLAGALTSRQLLTAIRSAGLSTSHLTRQQLTCQSDLQLPPAAGLLVELIGTLGKLQVTTYNNYTLLDLTFKIQDLNFIYRKYPKKVHHLRSQYTYAHTYTFLIFSNLL